MGCVRRGVAAVVAPENILDSIVARKRIEVARRRRHLAFRDEQLRERDVGRAEAAYLALRRADDALPRVIAER